MAAIATPEATMFARIQPDAVVFWTTTVLCLFCLVAV